MINIFDWYTREDNQPSDQSSVPHFFCLDGAKSNATCWTNRHYHSHYNELLSTISSHFFLFFATETETETDIYTYNSHRMHPNAYGLAVIACWVFGKINDDSGKGTTNNRKTKKKKLHYTTITVYIVAVQNCYENYDYLRSFSFGNCDWIFICTIE